MAINVTELELCHVVAGATRAALHDATQSGKIDMGERERFATKHGERNVTKYWAFPVVLAACEKWGVRPVLTQTGERFVKSRGGLTMGGKDVPATPAADKPKGVVAGVYGPVAPKPGAPRAEPQPEPVRAPDAPRASGAGAGGGAGVDRAEVERLVRGVVEQAREQDAEKLKVLIGGIATATAGTVLDIKAAEMERTYSAKADEILRTVRQVIDEARRVEITVRVGDAEPVVIDGHQHKCFEAVLTDVKYGENVMLIGPAGCGKTHLAEQVAHALGLKFYSDSFTVGMSESKLMGGLFPVGEGGKFEYVMSSFVECFRDGGLYLADEMDGGDPNVILIFNSALANGYINVPFYGRVTASKDFRMMGAMNTYGTGANRMYVGRNQLDEATLDRYRLAQHEMGYDRKLEETLVPHKELRERFWQIRDAVEVNKLRRIVSTRALKQAYPRVRDGIFTVKQATERLVMGWSPEERAKCGV